MVDTISGELSRVGRSENKVALQAGVDDLDDNVLVRYADYEAVLGRVVLVLRLRNEPLARVVCIEKSSDLRRVFGGG